jgi:hypothetical protein
MSFMRTASTFVEVVARDWPEDFFLSLVTLLQASLVLVSPGPLWPSLTRPPPTRGRWPMHPPPSLPYNVDTSCPSLRTKWTRLVPPSVLMQQRGALFARLRMELTLISLRASGTRLTGKHWATPFTSSQPAASRARPRSGTRARAAHALGGCPPRVPLSLPAIYALQFLFFKLVVIKHILSGLSFHGIRAFCDFLHFTIIICPSKAFAPKSLFSSCVRGTRT